MPKLTPYAREHPTKKNHFWCDNCQDWIALSEMKSWSNDIDYLVPKLCPSCDTELVVKDYSYDFKGWEE